MSLLADSLELLEDLLSCGMTVYHWKYTMDGAVVSTNCSKLILRKLFEEHDIFQTLPSYPGYANLPIILSGDYGIQWCASIEQADNRQYLHIIGPTFTSAFSSSDLSEMIKNANIPLSARRRIMDALDNISVVGTALIYQYCLMLHYAVTGQKLQRSQILSIAITPRQSEYYKQLSRHFNDTHQNDQKLSVSRRRKTYELERRLLDNIRHGNPGFEKDLLSASSISDGVSLSPSDPIQNFRTNGIVFTTLCTRAAIEGGLAPDLAYTIGDQFIDRINHLRKPADVKNTLDEMYKAFIKEVAFIKKNPAISHQILDIMKYIDNAPGEDLSLSTLAGRVGYAGEHLSRKFKAETGMTISAYTRTVRIEKAKELLTVSTLRISEIASAVGFSNSSLFASYFMDLVGMSPSEYREKHYLL